MLFVQMRCTALFDVFFHVFKSSNLVAYIFSTATLWSLEGKCAWHCGAVAGDAGAWMHGVHVNLLQRFLLLSLKGRAPALQRVCIQSRNRDILQTDRFPINHQPNPGY